MYMTDESYTNWICEMGEAALYPQVTKVTRLMLQTSWQAFGCESVVVSASCSVDVDFSKTTSHVPLSRDLVIQGRDFCVFGHHLLHSFAECCTDELG